MAEPTFMLHSIVCEPGGRVQVTYTDPAKEDPFGLEVTTAVIQLGPELGAEFAELTDAAQQLEAAWAALRRERRPR